MIAPLLAMLLAAGTAAPEKPAPELREIKGGEALTVRSDRAYLLWRIHRPKGVPSIRPVLLRVPTAAEMDGYRSAKAAAFAEAEPKLRKARAGALEKKAQAEVAGRKYAGAIPPEPTLANFNFRYEGVQNVNVLYRSKPFVEGEPDDIVIVEAIPGDYVLYGASWGGIIMSGLHTCFCLGTVGFSVQAGEVTDLGTFYGDGAKFKSKVPELAAETGFGPSSDTPFVLLGGTIRPVTDGAALPPLPASTRRVAAGYHAVGKFFNGNAGGINRLIPVPGVLSYDGGKVIDAQSGKEAKGAHPFQ